MDKQEFLNAIAGSNADKRFAAWRSAGEQNAEVVPRLIELSAAQDPGVAKAAGEALTTMTHAVGKNPNDPKRAPLAEALNKKHTALTLRLLSNIGGDAQIDGIAVSLRDPELCEEAIYALERIPGAKAEDAIIAAFAKAAPEFQPRILYALGHRKVKKAAALAQSALRNPALKPAAEWAIGRIGAPVVPEDPHAALRYAEANPAQAMAIYKKLLNAPEEHLQCAALVGLGRIGSAEAAQAVFPKLKSTDRKVRLTAAQVWAKFV
jgi:hypothetical protein